MHDDAAYCPPVGVVLYFVVHIVTLFEVCRPVGPSQFAVNEHVVATIVWCDKAESLVLEENLHCARRHLVGSSQMHLGLHVVDGVRGLHGKGDRDGLARERLRQDLPAAEKRWHRAWIFL